MKAMAALLDKKSFDKYKEWLVSILPSKNNMYVPTEIAVFFRVFIDNL